MTKRRILVIDDNPSLHEDFKKILVGISSEAEARLSKAAQGLFGTDVSTPIPKAEYELDFASQGEEGLNKVIAAQQEGRPYPLVFVDVRMPPGWDGITTIAKIWEKVPMTEIVICTAYSDYSLDDVISKLGVSDRLLFLKKPFDSVEVMQMAIALTKKWSLEQDNIKYTHDLEKRVEKVTKERDQERAQSVTGAKLMALGEMAAGVAHEINNPLTIIHQSADILDEMMDDVFDNVMGKKITKKIVDTTERIAKIIRGLRSISRSGENDAFEAATTGQLIEETLGICREKFRIHDIEINVHNPIVFSTLECRQVQIIQVLLNLLNNSYDAVEKSADRWVKIEVKETLASIELSVTDSGHGIPEKVREKMFQPFFTTKEIGKGTGLGLSISKGIIESHQGRFWFDESFPNTRFVMSLPKKQPTSADLEKAS